MIYIKKIPVLRCLWQAVEATTVDAGGLRFE